MNMRAGIVIAGALSLTLFGNQGSASAQELSEKAVRTYMDYAWSLTPQRFSKPDGGEILIDRNKRNEVMVPVETAREAIMAGRLSAHAQTCDLTEEQKSNHRAMMRRQEALKKWTPQQLVYISQLHLTTIMLLTGRMKLVEKQGDKEVVIDEGKENKQTCTDEQRQKVKERITAYVAASPQPARAAAPPAAGFLPNDAPPAGASPTATGSTAKPKAETAVPKSAATP